MKKKVTKKVLGLILLCMLIATSFVTALDCSPSYAQEKTFTFYNIVPLSGTAAVWGMAAKRAYERSAAAINAEGGIVVDGVRYKVEVQHLDNVYDTTKTAEVAQRVVNVNKAKFISIMGTGPVTAAQDFLAKNHVLLNANALASPAIIGPKWPLNFADCLAPADYGPAAYYPELIKEFGIKRVALGNPDTDSGRIFRKIVMDAVKNWNIPITFVTDEFYTPATQDFSPMILRMMTQKPDLIDLAGAGPGEVALFLKQVREKGYKGLTANSVIQADAVIAWRVAGAYSTGHFTLGYYGADPTPEYAAFKAKYEKEFGESMFSAVPYYYEHVLNIFRAITKANSFDPYKVADVLEDMTWTGLYGPSRYVGDEPGSPFGIKRIPLVTEPMVRFTTNGNGVPWKTVPYPTKSK